MNSLSRNSAEYACIRAFHLTDTHVFIVLVRRQMQIHILGRGRYERGEYIHRTSTLE